MAYGVEVGKTACAGCVPSFYGAQLFLSREYPHLFLVTDDQMGPRFVHTARLETRLLERL